MNEGQDASTRQRVRRIAPPSGPGYELFDCSVLVLTLASCWYIFSDISPAMVDALGNTLFALLNPFYWGIGLVLASLYGVFASYRPHLLKSGFVVLGMICFFWAISVFLGSFFAGGETLRTIGVSVLYFWIVRRLFREARPKP